MKTYTKHEVNALVEKNLKKAFKFRKKRKTHKLHEFENLEISDGEKSESVASASISSSSDSSSNSKWRTGSDEIFSLDKTNHSRKKIKLHTENLLLLILV